MTKTIKTTVALTKAEDIFSASELYSEIKEISGVTEAIQMEDKIIVFNKHSEQRRQERCAQKSGKDIAKEIMEMLNSSDFAQKQAEEHLITWDEDQNDLHQESATETVLLFKRATAQEEKNLESFSGKTRPVGYVLRFGFNFIEVVTVLNVEAIELKFIKSSTKLVCVD